MRWIRHVALGALGVGAIAPAVVLAGPFGADRVASASPTSVASTRSTTLRPPSAPTRVVPVPDGPVTAEPVPPVTVAVAGEAVDAPAPAPVPEPIGPAEAADIVRAAFARFGPAVQEQAVRIATCESHLDPRAIGFNRDGNAGRHDLGRHSSDWGLMQLNSYWNLDRYLPADSTDYQQGLDPHWNAEVAADLYASGGWRLWSTARYATDVAAFERNC